LIRQFPKSKSEDRRKRKRRGTKRFAVMGLIDSISSSRRVLLILLIISLGGQGSVFSQVPARRIRVEFRWAESSPGKGLAEARVRKTGESIYLHRQAVIKNEDIIEAEALEDPYTTGEYKVALVFTKQAARRMAKARQRLSGKRLAVLVNGKVISAPFLSGSINDKAVITGDMSKTEAERIANALNGTSRRGARLPQPRFDRSTR
jgi:hypothetical protein